MSGSDVIEFMDMHSVITLFIIISNYYWTTFIFHIW